MVLAAGSGTRMRSETPKVLHTLGGSQHAVARAARGGQGRAPASRRGRRHATASRVSPPSPNWPTNWAARSTSRSRTNSCGTGHAVALRAVGAARRLRRHRRRHLRRRPAAGRRHAGRADRDAQRRVGRRDRADHDGARPHRLRPHPAHPGRRGHRRSSSRPTPRPSQRAIREVNAGVYAFDIAALRSALSRLRSDNAQQRALPDRRRSRSSAPTGTSCAPSTSTTRTLVAGVNDRVQLAELGAELNRRIVAAPPAGRRDRRRPRHHLDRRRRRPSAATPSSSPARSCSAPPASAPAARSAPTPR